MTTTLPRPPLAPPRRLAGRPRARDVAVLFCLAGASGAALVAHILWRLELAWTAGFVVLPATALVVGAAFAGRRRYDRLAIVSDRLIAGAKWGLIATVVYDVVRLGLVWSLSLDFAPYRAQAIFGTLITGRAETTAVATAAGWTYHFWNGISFATMLSLVRPRAGWLVGWAWGLGLQALMMALYPRLLEVRLANPAFLLTTVVGHSVYGIVLGSGLRRGDAR